jgi:hypothetical protein
MLDDLAAVEPEDVDDRGAALPGCAYPMRVQDDEIAVGEDALDLAAQIGKRLFQEADKGLEAVNSCDPDCADEGFMDGPPGCLRLSYWE